MRKYLHIHLNEQTVEEKDLKGEELVKAGRYLIAKTLVESTDILPPPEDQKALKEDMKANQIFR